MAVLAAAVVALIWGLALSPKPAIPLPIPARLAIETALFVGVAAGLFATGVRTPALIGALLWIIDRAVLTTLRN